jgi:hypothetical protein
MKPSKSPVGSAALFLHVNGNLAWAKADSFSSVFKLAVALRCCVTMAFVP